MGFLSKMFGTKDAVDTKGGETRRVDFFTALSLHLGGDLDQAFSAYGAIEQEDPDYSLAPFFAAAITAERDNLPEAAERLRNLSRRISAAEETISRAVTRDLFVLVDDEPTLRVPPLAEIIVSLGDRLKQDGYLQESAVCFEIAAGLLPEHAAVLHKLGDTLHDLGMYEYAEAVLRKALEYAPNHWGTLYTYAVLLQDLGRFIEAIGYYEKAIALNPDHVKCRNNYGAALMYTGRLDGALAQCEAAARLDPAFPLAKVNLGNIHLLKNEYESARGYFNEAIALDQRVAPAYFGLGAVERCTGGDVTKIRELYLKAVELNPSNPQFQHALGTVLAGEGDRQALAHFAAAAQLHPSMENLQRDYGSACLLLGEHDEGVKHLRLALEQYPDDAMAQEILAHAEGENGGEA